ncbi:hypothetical protein V6O07_04430, partial [Arthrospira platensis SPKY2]
MTAFVQKELGINKTISMSGGVVLADDRAPVRLLADLAKQLQDEAKTRPGGGLDFLVLKSADMLAGSVSGIRN